VPLIELGNRDFDASAPLVVQAIGQPSKLPEKLVVAQGVIRISARGREAEGHRRAIDWLDRDKRDALGGDTKREGIVFLQDNALRHAEHVGIAQAAMRDFRSADLTTYEHRGKREA
jgi:hypothetical protein